MAESIITLGIGGTPADLFSFITTGLAESGEAAAVVAIKGLTMAGRDIGLTRTGRTGLTEGGRLAPMTRAGRVGLTEDSRDITLTEDR